MGERSTRRLATSLLVVAVVRLTAHVVSARLTESIAPVGPVDRIVRSPVPDSPPCQCCKKDRADKKLGPRPLLTFVLDGFDKPDPLHVCESCDGEELILSITKNSE